MTFSNMDNKTYTKSKDNIKAPYHDLENSGKNTLINFLISN